MKEKRIYILRITENDRAMLQDLCESGRGDYVAGYLLGRMFEQTNQQDPDEEGKV